MAVDMKLEINETTKNLYFFCLVWVYFAGQQGRAFKKIKGIRDAGSTADFRILFEIFGT